MSVPTVASLSATLGPHLAPAPGFELPETEISAVHISELDDPNAYLSGGELLLTTGLVLPATASGCQRYVARLIEARVSALALGLGPVHQEVPRPLSDACRKTGLALLVVPAPTPFTTITRAYWRGIAQATERQLDDVVTAHRALVDAAVGPEPAATIVRRLARVVDGWVALLDRDGAVRDAHPSAQAEEIQALRSEVVRLNVAGARSAASFAVGDDAVMVLPLAVEARVVGYLAAGVPRRLDQGRRRVVMTAAALLSLDAVRELRGDSAPAAHRHCVALLLDAGMADAARRLAAETSTPVPGAEVCLLALRGRDSDDLLRLVQRWCPTALPVRIDGATAWCSLPPDHPDPAMLAEWIAAADASAAAVLTEPVTIDRVAAVRARAQRAVRAVPDGTLAGPTVPGNEIRAALDRFLASTPAVLVEAVAGYLRHRGQWEPAARSLGLHRNTLRNRVARAGLALGLDVDDPDVAAEVWLTLRARGLA